MRAAECSQLARGELVRVLVAQQKMIETRCGTQEAVRMVHLTLASSCVWRRLGAELSTSSVDRRTTMGARRASFGVSSSGRQCGEGRDADVSQKN
jgi:hypothetical protein